MERVLVLREGERERLAAWAVAAYPHEACGLMLGRRDGGTVEVVAVRRADNVNVERARDRYEIAPADYLAAEQEAARAGVEVVGVWHTHPDHPAQPSPTDRELAWAGWSYVIAAVTAGGVSALRGWSLNGEREFEEQEIRS